MLDPIFFHSAVCSMRCLSDTRLSKDKTRLEVAKKVTDLSPRPLKDVDPRTPPFLSEIVERLLEKNPAKRYQSSLELLDVLNGHLAQLNQTPTDEFSTVLYQRSKPRRQSPPWLAVVTGIAVIALLTGVSFFKPWQAVQSQGKSEVGGEGELAVLPPRTIEVSKNGLAEFNSIQQALQVASPGSTIRVVDSGTYTEHIEFKGSKQLVVEAVAEPPAILLPLGPEFGIVSLTNVDEVTLRGFRLSVDNLHAIVLQDNCRSVTLDGLDFYQSDAGNATAMVLVNGGANADALTISNCHFVLDGNGQAIWISNGGPPLRNLRVERNRFRAKYTHLAIMRPVRNAIVRQNMFSGGKNGINLSMNEASQSEIPENCLQITNNSMVGVEYWLGVLGPVTDRQNYATVANNLLVDSGRLQGPVEELAKVASAWRFSANFWQHPPLKSADQERVKLLDLRMTSQLESVEVISKDLEDPRFGAPIEGDALYTEGVGGEFPKYVGAHGPAS